ncbi:MAG: rRNA maturation RNase YbeY [Muribaculaceae bacterium]|nr:rRNA maturation RNase YbeY [Muribaculaceae bacterium]
MADISYIAQGVEMPDIDQMQINVWIESVARSLDKSVGVLTYIFCNDEKILEVNRQYLKHDYYTDIITFDYSRPRRIAGDMFISLDTVASNASMLGKDYTEELRRVIIHGVLHLCGINDKGEGEREIMEAHENKALSLLQNRY